MNPNNQQQPQPQYQYQYSQAPPVPVYGVAPSPVSPAGYYQPQPQPGPQPQVVYVQTTYDFKAPLLPNNNGYGGGNSYQTPLSVKQRLLQRDYQVTIGRWFDESWALFTQNWVICCLFSFAYLLVYCIPYVGPFISIGLAPGLFIAGMHAIRPNGYGFKASNLFHGYLWFGPVLWISLLYELAVIFGLVLLIIPGFYLMIALSFSTYVYIEFKGDGIGVIDAMTVSRKVVSKHFCSILLLWIVTYLMNLLGLLVLFFGIMVSLPVSSFMLVFAFRDMFGFSSQRGIDNTCFCCC